MKIDKAAISTNYLMSDQESERLVFREISTQDFSKWLEFHKNPAAHKYWKSIDIGSPEEECKKWYDRQAERRKDNHGGMNALIEKDSGSFIGHCGLLIQTVDGKEELEIAYSLLPKFWGKGYATEAAAKCRDFAFEQNWAEKLISIISKSNTPSQKVAIKNGLTIEKETNYKSNDVFIFSIDRKNWNSL